ncbi:MAG: kelch repeat-containing protein [Verrucomicrobiota bacterium JB023]|nr:kelch repeat-containing protein [Verrucomicrobiota bacterium JB023]
MNGLLPLLLPLILGLGAGIGALSQGSWTSVESTGSPSPRHEHAFVELDGAFYALGGRRVQPIDIFDPRTQSWSQGSPPPLQLHHFQAVTWDHRIVIAGAFTGNFPAEEPVDRIFYYDPRQDEWQEGPLIPEPRRRGSAGAFIRDGKLYLVSGLIDGHRSGWVPWFDEYDFATGKWRQLPDAPRSRDHFQAVLIEDKVILAGGRRSGADGVFKQVVPEVDCYDFETGEWTTLADPIPTPRAGTSALAFQGKVLVIGGETHRPQANAEVEALDPADWTWSDWPPLPHGRHATQPVLHEGCIYLQAGSIRRGGRETNSMIRFRSDQ